MIYIIKMYLKSTKQNLTVCPTRHLETTRQEPNRQGDALWTAEGDVGRMFGPVMTAEGLSFNNKVPQSRNTLEETKTWETKQFLTEVFYK